MRHVAAVLLAVVLSVAVASPAGARVCCLRPHAVIGPHPTHICKVKGRWVAGPSKLCP